MITATLKSEDLLKVLENSVQYSFGFIDGVQKGKTALLDKLGSGVIAALNQYVDAMARSNPRALHHVYEWYQEGLATARLFDFSHSIARGNLSINGTFRQSNSVSRNATKPFYDKARIMEQGIPVVITPSGGGALRFSEGGKEVFTKRPVTVVNPGGDDVRGSFENVFEQFMNKYFRQSFLDASGLFDYIKNPILYKTNFAKGAKQGKNVGVQTGMAWISNATIGVDDA